jgi:hypothetical protein
MRKLFFTLLLFITCGIFSHTKAQTNDSLIAANYFAKENYNQALKEYLKLYRIKQEDPDINYKIGLCYLHINDDRSKAIPYLEFVYNKGGYKDELLLNMGLANIYAYKFDDALTFFTEYQKIINTKKFQLIDHYYEDCLAGKVDYQKKVTTSVYGLVDHYIENCESAVELVKAPVNVTFENLGKEINSKYPDYAPFVTQDQGTLYFSSRRDDNLKKAKNPNGNFTSDIYFSKAKQGQWTKAENMGPTINTEADEQCVYVTPDGQNMVIYMDNEKIEGDLFQMPLTGDSAKRISLNKTNSEYREYEGCLMDDGNTLIFSSDMAGGLGETDLYIRKKLPNGEWAMPRNLGHNINTKYKEAFPMYDEKSSTLYFASEGHVNMGGYDIFYSVYDTSEEAFGPATNMGYPINTPEDNMEFTLAENKRDGYMAAVRKEGLGDLDIYKVLFNDVATRSSIIRGVISLSEGDTLRKNINAVVSLKDAKTDKQLDSKNVNPQSGRYVFSVIPGQYILTVTSPGFRDVKEVVNVYDKSDYVFEIEKNIPLEKPGADSIPAKKIQEEKSPSTSTIIKGVISTNDSVGSPKKDIDAYISVIDRTTQKELLKKRVNSSAGKYILSVNKGNYILNVTSAGYENFKEDLVVSDKSDFFEIEKNIQLKQLRASLPLIKDIPKETPIKSNSKTPKKASPKKKKTVSKKKRTSKKKKS